MKFQEAVMPTDRVRALIVILFLASLFLGSLAGCGDDGHVQPAYQVKSSGILKSA
jgi:hypothetical protein